MSIKGPATTVHYVFFFEIFSGRTFCVRITIIITLYMYYILSVEQMQYTTPQQFVTMAQCSLYEWVVGGTVTKLQCHCKKWVALTLSSTCTVDY